MRCINVWNFLSEETRACTSICALNSRILQFISFSIRFQIILGLIYLFQGICQCFRYVNGYVSWHLPGTASSLLCDIILITAQINTIQKKILIQYVDNMTTYEHMCEPYVLISEVKLIYLCNLHSGSESYLQSFFCSAC